MRMGLVPLLRHTTRRNRAGPVPTWWLPVLLLEVQLLLCLLLLLLLLVQLSLPVLLLLLMLLWRLLLRLLLCTDLGRHLLRVGVLGDLLPKWSCGGRSVRVMRRTGHLRLESWCATSSLRC